jgi:hypothetical protein
MFLINSNTVNATPRILLSAYHCLLSLSKRHFDIMLLSQSHRGQHLRRYGQWIAKGFHVGGEAAWQGWEHSRLGLIRADLYCGLNLLRLKILATTIFLRW